MLRSLTGRFLIVFAILACESTVAWGWNAAGHKTVAEIAWRRLDTTTKSTVVDLLKQHPMFSTDFAPQMDSDLASGASAADKDHWIFCHAATWPDIARDEPQYHHATWHYINLPVFSGNDEAAAFVGQLPVNVFFDPASTPDENDFNGVQAVKWNLGILTDPSKSDPEKAIACCWILHGIGDLAQPLHCSALFSAELFHKGDHGGGLIKVKRANASDGDKLHSYWDGFLGTNSKFSKIKTKANDLVSRYGAEFNAPFVALPNDVWSTETQPVALVEAYQPLMNAVRAAEHHGGHLGTIKLPDSYFDNGTKVAERQAVIAGVRLAGVLKQATDTSIPSPALAGVALGFPGLIAPATPRAHAAISAMASAAPSATSGNDAEALAARVASLESQVRRLQAELSANSPGALNTSSPPPVPQSTEDKRSIVARALAAAPDHEDWDCGCGKDDVDRNMARPASDKK